MRRAATYADLRRAVEHTGVDVANRRSTLRVFLEAHGLVEHDVIGAELRECFPEALARYRDAVRDSGAGLATVRSNASRLRAVQRLVAPLEVLDVVGKSATDFASVLQGACAVSPLTYAEIARRAEVPCHRLTGWRIEGKLPSPESRVLVARLEVVLGLADGALLDLLPALPAPAPRSAFAEALRAATAAAGLPFAAAAERAGVPAQSVDCWVNGTCLPGRVGRTRDLPKLEAALGLTPGVLAAHLPAVRAAALPYAVSLTPEQAAEFQQFAVYKTDRVEHRADRKPLQYWRTESNGRGGPSAERFEHLLEYIYGFLALPVDHADPLLRGMGRAAAAGSLVDLADPEVILPFLRFRAARARYEAACNAAREAARPRAGGAPAPAPSQPAPSGFNGDTVVTLALVRSLVRKGSGYLWQAHHHGAAVAHAFPTLPPEEALARWRARLERADAEFAGFQHHLAAAELLAPTRNYAPIARILESDQPMAVLALLLERAQLESEQATRYSRSASRRAARHRDFLLLSLLCLAPLRRSHWKRMTYREDGSGHLRRVVDPTRAHCGHYELCYARAEFKALAGFRDTDYVAEIPAALTPVIEAYLREHRPVLAGADACDLVFRPVRGGRTARPGVATAPLKVNEIVAAATRRLIPEYAPIGMRTHAWRHIIATHLVRTDPVHGIVRAANALHNTIPMIQRHYGHLTGVDHTRRALGLLEEEYARVGRTGAAVPAGPGAAR